MKKMHKDREIRSSVVLRSVRSTPGAQRLPAGSFKARLCLALLLALCLALCPVARAAETVTTDLSSAAGVNWQFKPEGGEWKAIQVPAGGWKTQGFACDAGTYRATIAIPKDAAGNLVRVQFDAVNFGADVFAGADEAHLQKVAAHVNGWMPFSADVTSLATPSQPLLLQVEVKGRNKFKVGGKYTVPEGATWCPTLEDGILRGVHLNVLPRVHIEDVFVKTKVAPDTIQTFVTIANDSQRTADVELAQEAWWPKPAEKVGANQPVMPPGGWIPLVTATLAPGERKTLDSGLVPWMGGPESYWWPNVPYRANYQAQLHLLNLSLRVDGKEIHSLKQRFGFREFKVVGNHYELNGVRCNLRGDNQQEADFGTDAYGVKPGFAPPTADNPGWPQAVDNLLRLNFNVMRIHQIPATPYMLDVCDEKGLMLVEESPLRRSEGGEDFDAGRDNMLNMDRELVRRDRNHAATVIWSAVNEPFGVKAEFIRDLQKAIREVDDTRPVIADGIGDLGPDIINTQHYVNGIGGFPASGGSVRADRPYGETEAVWDRDNTWQGFAWMATSVRTRRLKGNADLRNYVLNNAWSNYVPGESAATEILEKKVKRMAGSHEILPALDRPWEHPNIRLMQQCYDPLAVCDVKFDAANARSNDKGEWPVTKPRLMSGTRITRQLAAFNDEFAGESVTVKWQLRGSDKNGPLLAKDEFTLQIPRGEFRTQDIAFDAPKAPGDVTLLLSAFKDGVERFSEDQIVFAVAEKAAWLVPDGEYLLLNRHSGHPLDASGDKDDTPAVQNAKDVTVAPVWRVKNLGDDEVQIINAKTGLALGVRGAPGANESPVVQQTPGGAAAQIWKIEEVEDGVFTLANKASGRLLDVYGQSKANNARVVQWENNGGENQQWKFEKAPAK